MAGSPLPEVLLCDTSFVGHVTRRGARPELYEHWPASVVDRIDRGIKAISVVTLAEERWGYRKAKWGQEKIAQAERRLASYLHLALDMSVVDEWGRLRHLSNANAWNVGDNDLWIAATASSRSLGLVTCDRDQERIKDPALEVIYLPVAAP